MKRNRWIWGRGIRLIGLLVALFLALPPTTHAAVDHTLFGELLDRYLSGGRVDYQGFKKEEARLDAYLEMLETVDIDALSKDEQFAFYTNAYNAWTIKLILTGYPGVTSIKDLGSLLRSPWKKKIVRLKSGVVTLDNVEHDILRPRFKDPRVHFAINCAAASCPPLYPEPFTGAELNRQLEDATRSFINDPAQYRLEGDKLYVSRIFKWFGEDFDNDLLSFFIQYADGDLKAALSDRSGDIDVAYLDYDWSLNGQ